MILEAGRTIEQKTHTCLSGSANDECNGLKRHGQHNDFSPFMPPFTTPSTYNAILSLEKHFVWLEAKQ